MLWYLLILAPLTDTVLNDRMILQLLASVVAYFNPGVVFCLLPLLVLQARLKVPEQQGHDTIRRFLLLIGQLNMIVMFLCS